MASAASRSVSSGVQLHFGGHGIANLHGKPRWLFSA